MYRTNTVFLLHAVRGALATGALAASLVVASAASANAQINFAGTTAFRYGNSGAFTSSLSFGGGVLSAGKGLTLANTGFNVFTVVTNPLSPYVSVANIGTSFTNSLGSATLSDRRNIYDGEIVQMLVTLTNPSAPSQQFSSTMTGTIYTSAAVDPTQSLSISWAPGLVTGVPFTGGPGTGWFDLQVNNTTIPIGLPGLNYITGNVAVTATPEPASMALVATGLIGMFGVARRRRNR